ncbi:MAG TPA: S8 family serine peptidase [Bacteroidales bacterium]|jgi:subtilisin family serine protease|nr:S8 family serine peptidase [Bacteroidales bacterium]
MKPPKIGNSPFKNKGTIRPMEMYPYHGHPGDGQPHYTGRHFLIHKETKGGKARIKRILESKWGFTVAETLDFKTRGINEQEIEGADALIYNELGITLLGTEDNPIPLLRSLDNEYFIAPEKVVYLLEDQPPSTWGIRTTGADRSRYTGLGVRLAVLDTGFDSTHPDFMEREITACSFVPEETAQDCHGHGTHCIGVAGGAIDEDGQRYGVASGASLLAGKVLSDGGSGAQSWVLNGITWAAKNRCQVISMSLGTPVQPGEIYDIAYERAARFALSKGALLVAAAGNDSDRSLQRFCPVSSPADCPSILAVGAIDEELNVANFSNRAVNPTGLVDFIAPGVGIHSAWVMPTRYRTLSGTSMATPHVAGIIALLWEKYPTATPMEIEKKLRETSKQLPIATEDVGVGLCMAP